MRKEKGLIPSALNSPPSELPPIVAIQRQGDKDRCQTDVWFFCFLVRALCWFVAGVDSLHFDTRRAPSASNAPLGSHHPRKSIHHRPFGPLKSIEKGEPGGLLRSMRNWLSEMPLLCCAWVGVVPVSSSSSAFDLTEGGARAGVPRALNGSRLSADEIVRSAEGSRSCIPPLLELLDLSEETWIGLGGVARPEARLRSDETPRDEGGLRSLESFRAEEDLKLSPR